MSPARTITGRPSWLWLSLAGLMLWVSPSLAQVRDPTAPPRAPTPTNGTLRKVATPISVTALFLTADGNRAVVNGQVVHAGDMVHGVEIVAIDGGGVRYRRNGALAHAPVARPVLTVKTSVEERNP